jgi:hypothetical protein
MVGYIFLRQVFRRLCRSLRLFTNAVQAGIITSIGEWSDELHNARAWGHDGRWHKVETAAYEKETQGEEVMPRLTSKASKKAKKARMGSEMHKFKGGKLHSGSKKGPVVKSRKQAIAIGLSESGQSKKKRKARRRKAKK